MPEQSYSSDEARKCCSSYFFQFPLEFPDASYNEDQNRCSSSTLSRSTQVENFPSYAQQCSKGLLKILWRNSFFLCSNHKIMMSSSRRTMTKTMGNFIKKSTTARDSLVNEKFSVLYFIWLAKRKKDWCESEKRVIVMLGLKFYFFIFYEERAHCNEKFCSFLMKKRHFWQNFDWKLFQIYKTR